MVHVVTLSSASFWELKVDAEGLPLVSAVPVVDEMADELGAHTECRVSGDVP